MNYIEWNNAIAGHFFREGLGNQPVFLCVTLETLQEVSNLAQDVVRDDFVAAIKQGPDWTQISGCEQICTKAMNCLYPDPQWKNRPDRKIEKRHLSDHVHWKDFNGLTTNVFPPYVAYLACFVLAWTERQHDIQAANYYTPLNNLLGYYNEADLIKSFDFGNNYKFKNKKLSTKDLWYDLETWSSESNLGRLYLADKLADADYVDFPKYFGLFKAADLRALPELFAQIEDGTGMPCEDDAIIKTAISYAKGLFTANAIFQLNEALKNRGLKSIYAKLLRDKFLNWDGSIPEYSGRAGRSPTLVLEPCATIRAYDVQLYWRCRFRGEVFSGEGYPLEFKADDGRILSCKQDMGKWSSIMEYINDGARLPAGNEHLNDKLSLISQTPGIPDAKYTNPAVFVFEKLREGNPDLVPARRVPAGVTRYALLRNPDCLHNHPVTFEPLQLGGVPAGWTLGKITIAETARQLPSGFPTLIPGSEAEIILESGIKVDRMTYLRKHPPRIKVEPWLEGFSLPTEWATPSTAEDATPGTFTLKPKDGATEVRLVLSDKNKVEISSKKFYLTDSMGICTDYQAAMPNKYGKIESEEPTQTELGPMPAYVWQPKAKLSLTPERQDNKYFVCNMPHLIAEPLLQEAHIVVGKTTIACLSDGRIQLPELPVGRHKAVLYWFGMELNKVDFTVRATPSVKVEIHGSCLNSLGNGVPVYLRERNSAIEVHCEPPEECLTLLNGKEMFFGDGKISINDQLPEGEHSLDVRLGAVTISSTRFVLIDKPSASVTLLDGLGNPIPSRFVLPSQKPQKLRIQLANAGPIYGGDLVCHHDKAALQLSPTTDGSHEAILSAELEPDIWHSIEVSWRGIQLQRRRFIILQDGVIMLGRNPGQVAYIKDAVRWDPIWLRIPRGKQYQILFAGNSVGECTPLDEIGGDKKAIRKWASCIYAGRKMVIPLSNRDEAALWKEYVKYAEKHC